MPRIVGSMPIGFKKHTHKCILIIITCLQSLIETFWLVVYLYIFFQEDQNRGKPNWEHLNDELHVLITVEDTENRAKMKLQRAVDEVRKLLTVVRYLENTTIHIIITYVPTCSVLYKNIITTLKISYIGWRRGWVKETPAYGACHYQRYLQRLSEQKFFT